MSQFSASRDAGAQAVVEKVSRLVNRITGIQLGARQSSMVESRMKKRLLELKIASFSDYLDYLAENEAVEADHLVSLLTTHHTYFFREFHHFEFVQSKLATLVADLRAANRKTLRVLCAACSRGHEVYSLALFLDRHLKQVAPDFDFEILGTDVDNESVSFAANGVYQFRETKSIPNYYMNGHLVRGQGEVADFVKIRREIKQRCRFKTANLCIPEDLSDEGAFDLIFCRNVYIYFSPEQIRDATSNLIKHLAPHGYFFIGISESLNGLNLPLHASGPSVYQHQRQVQAQAQVQVQVQVQARPVPNLRSQSKEAPLAAVASRPLAKVLCIDDSSSILVLLKRILCRENGFEVVGTAANGLEAAEFLRRQSVDLVTLDIHMPKMNGVEYLQKHYHANHPPVLMISSVAREDNGLALQALELGAADYVEKPTLQNLLQAGEEIRAKALCALQSRREGAVLSTALDRSIARQTAVLKSPADKLVVAVLAGAPQAKDLKAILPERQAGFPPVLVVMSGAGQAQQALAKKLSKTLGTQVREWTPSTPVQPDAVYFADIADFDRAYHARTFAKLAVSAMVFRDISAGVAKLVAGWREIHVLVEDHPDLTSKAGLADAADDIVPSTSFIYMIRHHLAETERWRKHG